MSARRILLLGAPGAGKGTQAVRVSERLGTPQIATGDMLRAAVSADTEVGREAKTYMERGELVPDDVVIRVAGERLGQDDAKAGFVLDGFPRTVGQAQALDVLLEDQGVVLEKCISMVVDEDVVVERLMKRASIEGRSDDNAETIRNRMSVYREQTEPLVAYYRERGVLAEVDGMGAMNEVERRIEEALR